VPATRHPIDGRAEDGTRRQPGRSQTVLAVGDGENGAVVSAYLALKQSRSRSSASFPCLATPDRGRRCSTRFNLSCYPNRVGESVERDEHPFPEFRTLPPNRQMSR
jgi:hypothetical protein